MWEWLLPTLLIGLFVLQAMTGWHDKKRANAEKKVRLGRERQLREHVEGTMKKIIGGKRYDTETSAEVGRWRNGYDMGDVHWMQETLFRNSKGAYFLHGVGGERTRYAKKEKKTEDMWSGGAELIPMTEDEAKQWAEERLTVDEYEAEFGECDEAAPGDVG